MSESVLITGGLGFIARATIPGLVALGYRVSVLDSLEPTVHGSRPDLDAYRQSLPEDIQIHVGSVLNESLMNDLVRDADVVVHLASLTSVPESMSNRLRYADENVAGTALLCDLVAMSERTTRVVLASSRAVYGEGPVACPKGHEFGGLVPTRLSADLDAGCWGVPCPTCGTELEGSPAAESAPLRPTSGYGLSKVAQEHLVQQLRHEAGVEIVILRLQNVYGPGQSRSTPDVGVANILCEQVLAGQNIELYEDGLQLRDFVYVDDVATAFTMATAGEFNQPSGSPQVLNIGTGIAITLKELAQMIAEGSGMNPTIRVSGRYRIGDVRHCVADVVRIKSLVGWDPAMPQDGVARLLDWQKASSSVAQNRVPAP